MATRQQSVSISIPASQHAVFSFIDNHENFSSHMNQRSWMMGGGRMVTELDDGRGQVVGSHIRMSGRVFGINLALDEIITSRTPDSEKSWETVGSPRLLVIGWYRMGFQVRPEPDGCGVTVFIDYTLPESWFGRMLGLLFADWYADWCVTQMADGAAKHFAKS